MFLIKLHLFIFFLTWVYILVYPLINKIFKLELRDKYSYEEYKNMFITSITPGLNLVALYYAINEDIETYSFNKKWRR